MFFRLEKTDRDRRPGSKGEALREGFSFQASYLQVVMFETSRVLSSWSCNTRNTSYHEDL